MTLAENQWVLTLGGGGTAQTHKTERNRNAIDRRKTR